MFDYTELARQIHADNKAKGFWDEPRSLAEITSLIHSEITELYEAYRAGNPPSSKIDASLAEEELADIAIRTLDYAGSQMPSMTCINSRYVFRETDMHEFVARLHSITVLVFSDKDYKFFVEGILGYCLDWARQNDWDLDNLIQLKLAYNRTRPRKHGKAF